MVVISYYQARLKKYPVNKFFIQTILFDKSISLSDARKWLRDNDLKYNDYRKTINHRRFMQTNPVKNAVYFTKKITPLIQLVFQKI